MIAKQEVNLSKHFGDHFSRATTEMELTKKAQGSIVKGLTYEAKITVQDAKDKDMYKECVTWRKVANEAEEHEKGIVRQSSLPASASAVAGAAAFSKSNDLETIPENIRAQSVINPKASDWNQSSSDLLAATAATDGASDRDSRSSEK